MQHAKAAKSHYLRFDSRPGMMFPMVQESRDALRRIAITVAITVSLGACGGGSGSPTSSPPVSSGPPTVPSTPPPAPNQSPVLVHPASDQRLIVGHTFTFDASQGGSAVTDPDGDPLTWLLQPTIPGCIAGLPPALTIAGTTISGAPTAEGACEIEVQVDDGRGGNSVSFRFYLRIVANSPPTLVHANNPQMITAGALVDYDATQGGAAFQDPDGDSLTYQVSFRGNPNGLAIAGTRIAGTFGGVGAVEVIITANDGYGGHTADSFLIAAPAAVPTSAPALPSVSDVYRDEDLPLPFIFSLSSQSIVPLWDTQPADNRTSNAGATLGRVLFYDKRLSITNTVACASCHQQAHGFASPEQFSVGVLGLPLKRNSMALANARYNGNFAWFSDMRVQGDLRNLIFQPLENHDELGMSLYAVETKLQGISFYPPLFAAAFGTSEVTHDRIAQALAQFVQSIISYRSKSDLANNPMTNGPGNPAAVFTSQEMRGLQIYEDHCQICHELHANTNVWQANNGLDVVPTDPGTQNPALQRNGSVGVFRAASLRNIAQTSPYMHDGRFTTLREVIDHYDHDVKDSPNLDAILRDSTGAVIRLNLSESDKNALEAFLNTLTDDALLNDPKFSDPFPP